MTHLATTTNEGLASHMCSQCCVLMIRQFFEGLENMPVHSHLPSLLSSTRTWARVCFGCGPLLNSLHELLALTVVQLLIIGMLYQHPELLGRSPQVACNRGSWLLIITGHLYTAGQQGILLLNDLQALVPRQNR